MWGTCALRLGARLVRSRNGRVTPAALALAVAAAAVLLLGFAAISGAAPGTDASVSVYDQCANDKPPSTATNCPGGWINGILNANNSHYAEDEVTPQRTVLELPSSGPLTGRTVEISWLTRKSGHHAYDSLATWNHTQTTADRCQGLSGTDCVGGAASTFAIPPDPTVVNDPSGGGATSAHQLTGQVLTMYGATITGVSSYTHDDAGGTSDSYAHLTVTYSVPSTPTKVMLLFGGHLGASLGPRGWGAGLGAGSISGGPYHIRITGADGASVGNRDNQIMSGAILAPANIVIVKNTVGGDATFDYTATGGVSSPFQITTSGGTGQQSFTNITAGIYSVTESATPSGWVLTGLVCTDPDSGTQTAGPTATIDLDPGETVTCTYTNKRQPRLTVIKHVVNDNGGTAAASAWTMNVAGPTPLTFAGAESPGTTNTVTAGNYQVTESGGPAGYSLSYSGDCDANGNVSVALGESKTCTLTNNDQAASLTVIKHVVNDNGGTAAASAWTMNVAGATPLTFAGAESPGTTNAVNPGSYTVTESGGPAGYALTYSGDCNSSGQVTVALGQSKTCTLTNNDQAASLTVIKHVVNDSGGTAVASAWTMNAAGPTPLSFPGAESPGTTNGVNPGSYTVTESGPSGYALTYSGDCNSSGQVTVALGQSKTCTLTNNDQAASLIVIKHVVNDNGGTAVAADFSMTVDDPGTNPPSFPGAESPGTQVAVDPGAYSVSESGPAGYAASLSADCTGTIALGQTKTCTVTNDDVAPKLIVVKHVVNDEGGTKVAADFTMNVTGSSPSPASFAGVESPGTQVGLNAGAYNVTESGPTGYTASFSADCTGSIAVGQTKTCTVTNDDDVLPEVEVVKTASPTSVPETAPGTTQNVVFTYTIYNRSAEPLKITQFVDDKFDLGTKCPSIVGLTLAKDDGNDASGLDQVSCNFAVGLSGNAGSTHVNVVDVTGVDDEGDEATDSDDAVVTFTNLPSSITVIKTATPTSLQAPGGPVTFTVSVRNDSAVDTVTITSLVDSIHGNLNGKGTCSVPQTILPGATYTCSFTANVTQTETDVVTGSGTDDDGNPVSDSDDATVTVTPTPPPPPSAPETMDVAIVKDATAQVTLGPDGTAVIDYEARVRNNGPNQAHNVTLADPAPSGVTFLAITQQPSQGSCTLTAALLSCNFGTLGPGVQVTVRWNARVTATGSFRNVATATGQGTDTNSTNNTDDAVTLVVAPLTPPPPAPKPKPRPKPAAEVCRTLAVGPKLLQATSKPQFVTIKVVQGRKAAKGVRVLITGPGIKRVVTTNAKGVVRVLLKPSRAGILRFEITNAKACTTQRIGVVGVFEPPVTG
jgi:uncharacterized repeat protein (TIGR01451 family)